MQNIISHEFEGENGYAIHTSNLFEVIMHILSIEPIELLKGNGENILYSNEEAEDELIGSLFERYRSSSSNISNNNMVSLK
jgi:hypothetical protein